MNSELITFRGGWADPQKNAYFLNLQNPERVLELIKSSVRLDQHLVAVPPTPSNTVLLLRLGIKVPSKIRWAYRWPITPGRSPFFWQEDTSEFMVTNPRSFIFNSAGTGKTCSTLWAYDYLRTTKAVIEPMLVLCPKSCVRSVWYEEAQTTVPHLITFPLMGTGVDRVEDIHQRADIYVTNHHTLLTPGAPLLKRKWGAIVLDEATVAQDPSTQMWEALRDLSEANPAAAFWCLTATPCSQSPTQAYGLAKLINPAKINFSKTSWQKTVQFNLGRRDPSTGKPIFYKWVDQPDATEKVHKLLQPAIRIDKREVMQFLPPITFTTREVDMEPGTKKAYEQMRRNGLVQIAGQAITAVHAANQANKLLQISSGVLIGEDGTVRFSSKHRLSVLKEIIETSDSKTIVAVPFTEALHAVAEEVAKYRTVKVIYGDVSDTQRAKIVAEFQTTADPQVLVVQPKTTGHGLTLVAASTIVWWSAVYSQETYKQMCERTDRPGQKHPQRVIHLSGTPAEKYVYNTLQDLGSKQLDLLSMYQAQ